MIKNMHEKGYTLEQIADVAEKSIEDVKAVIKGKSLYWYSRRDRITGAMEQ